MFIPTTEKKTAAKRGLTGDKELLVLKLIGNLDEPVGSGNLAGMVEDLGINISPASIGRILQSLERKGFLEKDRNKGRKITTRGDRAMREAMDRKHVEELRGELDEMLSPKTLRTFIMILEARKVIESATVRMAAANIDGKDLLRLRDLLEEREMHIRKAESISRSDREFHTVIARASGNDVLSLIYQIVSQLGQQSELFEYMRKKASGAYLRSHRDIYDALAAGDADAAESGIRLHMDALISDVEKYWTEHPGA